jgi:hypothetical protein
MAKGGTYYLGRVLKLGILDQEKLIQAIKNPSTIYYRENAWTFIDVVEHKDENDKTKYLVGHLSKFAPSGEITKIDTISRSEVRQYEPNLSIASSTFIYIPEHSGIAFLHVYNHIEQATFVKRFREIINATYDNFFVDNKIEMVVDLRTFAAKLASLDGIYRISAKISPPNPLFGPLWEPLKDYLVKRNTDTMQVVEDALEASPLNTKLPEYVQKVSEQTEDNEYVPAEQLPIGDAAILMAADGYGSGTVKGKHNNETVLIKTSETRKHFVFDKNPDSGELYIKTFSIFEKIKSERHMRH